MNITFRQGSEELSEKLLSRSQTKLSKLGRFITERNYEAQVYVDVERESGSQNSESMWRTSINLDLAGDRFNAVAMGSTPDQSTDLAIKELKRELNKSHEKHQSVLRKSSALLKRLRTNTA